MPGVTFDAKSAPVAGGAVLTSYVNGEGYCCVYGGRSQCRARVVPTSLCQGGKATTPTLRKLWLFLAHSAGLCSGRRATYGTVFIKKSMAAVLRIGGVTLV